MKTGLEDIQYVPGIYAKKRAGSAELADRFIKEWDKRWVQTRKPEGPHTFAPVICFSRKIGVGALEVADILAEKRGYHVIDREIIEHIADQAKLSESTVSFFDERYPGLLGEFLAMAFGEKSFIESDYSRNLFKVVYSIAGLQARFGTTIFVGRGIHLLLPRERVLAVRMISSMEHRVKRLAGMLGVNIEEAINKLEQIDKEQRDFFKRVYGKKDASPYEFDLIINFDYFTEPKWIAEIVDKAFQIKFKDEMPEVPQIQDKDEKRIGNLKLG